MSIKFFEKNNLIIGAGLLFIWIVSFIFDKGLAVGLGLLTVLSVITVLVLYKIGFRDKKVYWLFLIVLVIHLGTTLFMHYADFQPFSDPTL